MKARPLRVCIATVFSPSIAHAQWDRLQRHFLQRHSTGIQWQRDVFANGLNETDASLLEGVRWRSADNIGHAPALGQILADYRNDPPDVDYVLILDSDCFPVHDGWLGILHGLMQQHGKDFAAPVRVENLDRFPHPCAFLLRASSLRDPGVVFDTGHRAPNLLGHDVEDVGNAMLPLLPRLLPLLRSNRRNHHPVAAAVYNHLFYHHGAGSRGFRFRATHREAYYAHWWDNTDDEALMQTLMERLQNDPDAYVASLMRD